MTSSFESRSRPRNLRTSVIWVPTPIGPWDVIRDSTSPSCHFVLLAGLLENAKTSSTGRLISTLASTLIISLLLLAATNFSSLYRIRSPFLRFGGGDRSRKTDPAKERGEAWSQSWAQAYRLAAPVVQLRAFSEGARQEARCPVGRTANPASAWCARRRGGLRGP